MKITFIIIVFVAFLFVNAAHGKSIPVHAGANLVLGQSDFTSANPNLVPTANSLHDPTAIVVDRKTRKVFVADSRNNRVLRYASANSLSNGASAEAVLGQANFTSRASLAHPTAQSMKNPSALFFDHNGRLWVADSDNNRVLRFDAASSIDSQKSADRVYGQPDFVSNLRIISDSGMNFPAGVWVDNSDRLWVADKDNNRVLRFDEVSNKLSGAAADGVIGQPDFVTDERGSGATGLQAPRGIAISPVGALFVAASDGNRVMRFDNAANLGFAPPANAVFGQKGFASTGNGLSATKMNYPSGLTVTVEDSLWVTDSFNNRVIRFDQASTKPTGSPANGVVGQPNLTTDEPNTTNRGFDLPYYSPFVDAWGSLWVAEMLNDRVLRFPTDTKLPLIFITSKIPKSTKDDRIVIRGVASDRYGISKVQFRVGAGESKTAAGKTTWRIKVALKKGENKIVVFAFDSTGNVSAKKVIKIEGE